MKNGGFDSAAPEQSQNHLQIREQACTNFLYIIFQWENGTHEKRKIRQLAHSLDQVEQQLAHQISKRSEAFFKALTSQQELHREVQGACESISTLR